MRPPSGAECSTASTRAQRPAARGAPRGWCRPYAGLILENGKSMIAAQSADAIGDRQVTVEVKATILR